MRSLLLAAALIVAGAAPLCAQESEDREGEDGAVSRGEYVFTAAGCLACHTDVENDGAALAGGRALETPFGTFYSPNITPDPATGIGEWTERDLARALTEGLSPDGEAYYPAFPYTSYTGMTAQDVADLYAYLMSRDAVTKETPDHDLAFYVSPRISALVWQELFFSPAAFEPDAEQDEQWNRGAYLTRHLGHCGECHTPRGLFGARDRDQVFAGTEDGPEGETVPNITPHEDGIAGWDAGDVAFFLQTGLPPDGDAAGGSMGEVIEHSTSKLTQSDREAIAAYLLSVEPKPDS